MNPNERTSTNPDGVTVEWLLEMAQSLDRSDLPLHMRAAFVKRELAKKGKELLAAAGVALPTPPIIPEGFRLLPVEATDSMMDADWDVSMSDAHSNGGVSAAAWRAMVEAAPQVTYGNGHSGVGWYMHDTEYPEEGAVFLSEPAAGVAPCDGGNGPQSPLEQKEGPA